MKVGFLKHWLGIAHASKTEHIWILMDHPNVWTYTSTCGIVVSRVDISNFRQFRGALWDTRDRGAGFPQCKRCMKWRKKHGDGQTVAELLGGIDLSIFKVPNAS